MNPEDAKKDLEEAQKRLLAADRIEDANCISNLADEVKVKEKLLRGQVDPPFIHPLQSLASDPIS